MLINTANIRWLASGEPFSEQFQDFYFSTDGGLQESEYVFLQQNGFPQRFKTLAANAVFHIGETGFGTGLNFLTTACHWLQTTGTDSRLEYIAVEKYPLNLAQIQQVYTTFKQSWPQLSSCCDELLTQYSAKILSAQQHFELFNKRIHLTLIIDDATAGLQQFLAEYPSKMDAWYLDGFAPAKNPDMWHSELFNTLAQLSKPGSTISTFTSAGIVRRGLIAAGFRMSKAPGLGKKREILYGVKE